MSDEQDTARDATSTGGAGTAEAPVVRRREALLALVALAAVVLVALVAYRALAGGVSPAREYGSQATSTERKADAQYIADFDARVFDVYGDARTITALADGRPLVMNFWATWCPYCVDEMADYQGIYDEYADRVSFAFIDVTDGERETVEDASAWLSDNGYGDLPAYYDTSLDAMRSYGATNLPTTVVVAADGEIVDISAGRIDPDALRSLLDSLLEG